MPGMPISSCYTMPMKSKICGIPTVDVAKRIISLGPDAIGVYCWKEAEKGANFVTIKIAQQIVELATAASINTFYLTYALTAKEAFEDCSAIGNTHIQLLGDMPAEEIAKLRTMLPALQAVKVIGVTGPESIGEARQYAHSSAVDQLLLDSRSGSVRGGTGKTHDWSISRQIAQETTKPVWLAGGIRLHNVQEAMTVVRPYGIDVETGVQNQDGTKNYDAVQDFIKLVRGFSG